MTLFIENIQDIFRKEFDLNLSSATNISSRSSDKLESSIETNKKSQLTSFSKKNNNNVSHSSTYRAEKNTKVYFVVNKFNEIVQVSSRLYKQNFQRLKPMYFIFLSKEDAIDFLYKVALSDPTALKKSGLGVNSFSLEKFVQVTKKNTNKCDVVLINNLNELEMLYSNLVTKQMNINISNKNTVSSKGSLSSIICYRINNSSLSDRVFFTLTDVKKSWNDFNKTNSPEKNKSKRCSVKVEFVSLDEIQNSY